MTPANRPKSIVIAVEKDGVADCTLTFEAALAGKMEPGEHHAPFLHEVVG